MLNSILFLLVNTCAFVMPTSFALLYRNTLLAALPFHSHLKRPTCRRKKKQERMYVTWVEWAGWMGVCAVILWRVWPAGLSFQLKIEP